MNLRFGPYWLLAAAFLALPGSGLSADGCPNGPEPGKWVLEVGTLNVMGVFIPLAGGKFTEVTITVSGCVDSITATSESEGTVVFTPTDVRFSEFTQDYEFKATTLPAGLENVTWLLHVNSSSVMEGVSIAVIDASAPPHIQFHRWNLLVF